MRLSDIAALTGGRRQGGSDPEIRGVAPLDRAGPQDLAPLSDARYIAHLKDTRAAALLVEEGLSNRISQGTPAVVVASAPQALAVLLEELYPSPPTPATVHPTAVIAEGVIIGVGVSVGPYTVIGAGCRLGDRARIAAHVVLGERCVIGDDVVLHPHVTLYADVEIGPRSIVHSGARLGVDGFGYALAEGQLRKVPQVGRCRVGADVEVGANTCIDRGSIGSTDLGSGVKVDNLVHVAHNVRVGDHSILVAQVGIAGSTTIGRGVTVAGQAGIAGHVFIGDGATVGGQAGVFGDVPAGATYSGYPARPHQEALRAQAGLFRLPDIIRRLRALERRSRQGEEM